MRSPRTALRTSLIAWAIVSPLLLVIASDEWLFTPQGFLDAWDYVGFFLNYQEPEYYPYAYKLGRLPWILSGWLVHYVLPALPAAYVLHAGYLLLATAGFWLLLNELFRSTSCASFGALLLGFYTHFHGSGGWDYHNTAAGAYYIWAMFALTYAARVGTAPALAAAGAVAALAVHANITLVNMLPVLAAHFVVLQRGVHRGSSQQPNKILRAISWTMIGGLSLTAVLMVISAAVGRNPIFFKPLVDIVVRYVTDPSRQTQWWQPWATEWVVGARHLSLLFAAAVASSGAVLGAVYTRRRAIHALVYLEFLALVGLWTFWQSAGQTALNWDYFAFPLIPHAFLAVVALLDTRERPVPELVVAVAPLMLAAPLVLAFHPVLAGVMPGVYAVGAAVPAAVLFLMAFACLVLPRPTAVPAFLVFFALGNADAAVGWDRYATGNNCRIGASLSTAVIDLNRLLSTYDPRLHKTSLWFQDEETLQLGPACALSVEALGYSLQASGVPNVADNPHPMPPAQDISATALRDLAAKGNRLAVLTADGHAWRAVEGRATELGLALRPVATRSAAFGNQKVVLTLADVVAR